MAEQVKRIKLIVEEPAGIDRKGWPVTQGVPFADGELERGSPVRVVTAAGCSLPTQALCLATWAENLRYVKWLLVDFQIDLRAGEKPEVYLEYGPAVSALSPENAITLERTAGRTLVNTGAMQAEFRHGDADFLASCCVKGEEGWRNLLRGRPGPYLYMTDQAGRNYDSWRAAPSPVITIEQAGPLRTSLGVKGYHASADGRRFCPYILRLHFYAGKADLRCYHTFLFDQDPERLELAEVGVRFPLHLGDGLRMTFGGEQGPHRAGACAQALLLQSSDLEYRVEQDGAVIARGGKSRGWASLSGEVGSVVAVLRDMWQEYPKGMALNAEGLDVQVWPARFGETLKFSTPFKEEAVHFNATREEAEFKRIVEGKPTAPLNLKSLNAMSQEDVLWVEEMVAKYAPGRAASYNDTGTCNGFGAAKTTEFLLRFSAQEIPDTAAEGLSLAVQEPVIAPAGLAYACATGAMRFFAPFAAEGFGEVERELESLFERVVAEPRRVLRTYGMIDYGDLMCSHSLSPWAMWTYFKDAPDVIEKMKHCARSYNNEANDQIYALWGFFLHSGERKHFLAAEAYGEHVADVDIIHATPDDSPPGLIHYHNAHHWSGFASPSHTCIAGLMLQYYLTGNRRILEVCREVADWAFAHQEPCGLYSHRQGPGVREYTTPIHALLELYQATWERKYGDLARRSLKWLLLAMPEPGCFPESIFTAGERGDEAEEMRDGWDLCQAGGMTPQVLYDAARVFSDDPIFKNALLGMANRYVWGLDPWELWALLVGPRKVMLQDPYFNAPLIAYAYELTEDPVYAAYCRYYLREHFPKKAQEGGFTYICWGSIVPPLMEAVRRAEAKYGSAILDGAEQHWVERISEAQARGPRESYPSGRPYAPRRSLGIIRGYDS